MTELDLAQSAFAATHCMNAHLRRTTRAIGQLYDHALRPSGLRGQQFSILVALSIAGKVTISYLAEGLVMDRTTLSRNLKPLQRDGLITIEPGADQRQRVITLSPEGRAKLAEALPLWQQAQDKMMAGFPSEQFEHLLQNLSKAIDVSRSE